MESFNDIMIEHGYADGYFCVDRLAPCSVHVFVIHHPDQEQPYEIQVSLYVQSEVVVLTQLFFSKENEAKSKFHHLIQFYQQT